MLARLLGTIAGYVHSSRREAEGMRYRPLGNSGLVVSVVGLGCNNFGMRLDASRSRAVVDAAIDSGVTLLDTAESYSLGRSEEILGEVLAGRRDQVVLATKFGGGGDMGYGPAAGAKGGRSYIRRAVEHSLRRLRTDYIDLYQLHRPDPVTPIEETIAALTELVHAGLIRYLGHSNFSAAQISTAAAAGREPGAVPFVSAQNHWSLLERAVEQDVVPTARQHGLGVLPYFPLANGLLAGKIRRGVPPAEGTRLAGRDSYITDAKLDTVEDIAEWAQQHGRSMLDVAIGGLAAQPGCTSVIAGATSAEQVHANVAAGEWVPDTSELAEIDKITTPVG
jgi:aryl-alcohol dehydrogenase-like predicted oxidoreductase